MDGTQTGTNISGQSGHGSNSNEGVIHTHQIYRTGASPPDAVYNHYYHTQDSSLNKLYKLFLLHTKQPWR